MYVVFVVQRFESPTLKHSNTGTSTRRVLEESDDDAITLQIASHDSFEMLSSRLETRQEDLLFDHASDLYVHISP